MTRQALLFSVALLVGPQPVLAQNLGSAPKGGVFGDADTTARSRLDLNVALSEGLDSEVPPELRPVLPQGRSQSGGYSSMLSASADYERIRRRAQVAASGVTTLRHYQQLDQVALASHSAALGATMRLPRRATFEVNLTGAYSPSYFYSLFPAVAPPDLGEAVPPAQDYRVDDQQSFSYTSRATFAAGSTRGNRVSITAERSQTDFRQEAFPRPDLDTLTGRARWSHGVGRTGVLSAEYEYREGEFGFGGRTTEQRLRLGAEYSPALSVSRRALFRFNLAPSVLEIPESALNAVVTGAIYRMEGDAAAEYPFLRSWYIGGSFRRGVEYIAVLRGPVFRDVARLELNGLATRRLDVSASAGYVVGQSALVQSSQRFDAYTGTTRARYAVTRSFALYAEYLYYYYDLRGQRALAPDLQPVFEQHGVRVGVMFWARPVGR